MIVADKVFVAIDYRLSLGSGEAVDHSPEGKPLGFIVGTGRIIPGLESALMGRAAGDTAQITLEPEDAYGPVDQDLFKEVPMDKFPDGVEVKPGMAFEAQGPRGPAMITVAKINDDDTVTVDLNHPMAGKRLIFDVTVVEVREPLAEELSQLSAGCACGSSEGGGESCGSSEGGGEGCGCG
jgi:FKBP-type peptidyl-prolyl cis-trans isomerase SlyD